MNAKEALEALNTGKKVRTIFDGEDVFYRMYQFDIISRMMVQSYCTASTISNFTPNEFVENHDGIEMVISNI